MCAVEELSMDILEAVKRDDDAAFNELLDELGANFGLRERLLFLCIEFKAEACLRYLIRCGADLNKLDHKAEYTPLSFAAKCNYQRGMELLLYKGADPLAAGAAGSPEEIAEAYHYGCIAYWLSTEPVVCARKNAAASEVMKISSSLIPKIYRAIEDDDSTSLQTLVDKPDLDYGLEDSLLMCCVKAKSLKCVAHLLQWGADINQFGNGYEYTPLSLASERGFEEVVQILLDKSANPNSGGASGSPLDLACRSGSLLIVQALLNFGAAVNPSSLASIPGLLSNPLPQGLELNLASLEKGWTPLMSAVQSKCIEVVQLLLAHDANPDALDEDSNTAIVQAGRLEAEAIVDLLEPITTDEVQCSRARQLLQG